MTEGEMRGMDLRVKCEILIRYDRMCEGRDVSHLTYGDRVWHRIDHRIWLHILRVTSSS